MFICCLFIFSFFFFFNDTATTEIYTLSLHDALPICDGAVALFSLCKDGRKERERGRHERCRANPLEKAGADEDPRLPGEPTDERGCSKQGEPCDKEPSAPVKITCAPEQEHEAAEGERVAVEDPPRIGARKAQLLAHRRQRDANYGGVDHRNERSEA